MRRQALACRRTFVDVGLLGDDLLKQFLGIFDLLHGLVDCELFHRGETLPLEKFTYERHHLPAVESDILQVRDSRVRGLIFRWHWAYWLSLIHI